MIGVFIRSRKFGQIHEVNTMWRRGNTDIEDGHMTMGAMWWLEQLELPEVRRGQGRICPLEALEGAYAANILNSDF